MSPLQWYTHAIKLPSSGASRSLWTGSSWEGRHLQQLGGKIVLLSKEGGRVQLSTQPSENTGIWLDLGCGPLFGDSAYDTQLGSPLYIRQAPTNPTPIGEIEVIFAVGVPCQVAKGWS